jgi:hypothetical protein
MPMRSCKVEDTAVLFLSTAFTDIDNAHMVFEPVRHFATVPAAQEEGNFMIPCKKLNDIGAVVSYPALARFKLVGHKQNTVFPTVHE